MLRLFWVLVLLVSVVWHQAPVSAAQRVLLTAEGEPEELDRFVAGIVAAMGRRVAGYDTDETPARGNFHDFTIQY